jgi:glycosyltransferase involved in cell wall biosynthesis
MTEKQKIAFLCHPYHRGGVTRWMADAAITLSGRGYEVYFITVEPKAEFHSGKGRETLLQLLGKQKHSIHIIKARAGYEFEFGTSEYRTFIYKQLIATLPPGTPIILSDETAIWAAAVFFHATHPIVGVLHADENYYYNLAEKYCSKIDVLVGVSGRVSNVARERIKPFGETNIFTIPCGIHLPEINYNTHTGDILQLVYAGRISEYQKRVSDLVKIAALMAKMDIKFHLNIIGDGGTDKVNLEHAIAAGGLQNYVTLAGWRSQKEVADYLSESDILVLTSDFEGTPIAMMEALAAGCGMAGTRVSGIEDFEYHPLAADCLAVFAVGDLEDAVRKINKLASIPGSIRKQAARKLAETEFSMDVCLDRYIAAIGTIKKQPAASPAVTLSMVDRLYSVAIAAARNLKISMSSK